MEKYLYVYLLQEEIGNNISEVKKNEKHKKYYNSNNCYYVCYLFSTIFAATITHFSPEYGVTTANVNLRNKPNTDYSSFIRTLDPNTKIKLVGSIDNFYIVQLENNEVGINI